MQLKNYLQIFRRFNSVHKDILQKVKKVNQNSFVRLWITPKDYLKHLKKRLKHKDIKNRFDYFAKTITTLSHPQTIYYLKSTTPSTKDKIIYIQGSWVVIACDDGKIITSFPLKKSVQDILRDKKNKNFIPIPLPLPTQNKKGYNL
ncbi:hypothetical protein [Nitratiruptor sp. YY09-18]|uniref:hypothetical protein n=1 Tax=Nitratiruptor sp. YY09-18 TaxID=2724901 RepID=UPI0019152C50|nr:hypothetical protein [Nitratiruptor sp. YY09-18]BCD67261.1 hypothetical protein NitYY0918_C0137 [Nitratiruptor sp. YY09-18]